MEKRMKKIVGLILGLGLTVILTYLFFSAFPGMRPGRAPGTRPEGTPRTRPGQFPGIAGIATILPFGIVAVSSAVAGFVSSDWRIGLIAGIVSGLVGFPLTSIYSMSLAFGENIPFFNILGMAYPRSLATYILNAIIGCVTGAFAAYIGTRIIKH